MPPFPFVERMDARRCGRVQRMCGKLAFTDIELQRVEKWSRHVRIAGVVGSEGMRFDEGLCVGVGLGDEGLEAFALDDDFPPAVATLRTGPAVVEDPGLGVATAVDARGFRQRL